MMKHDIMVLARRVVVFIFCFLLDRTGERKKRTITVLNVVFFFPLYYKNTHDMDPSSPSSPLLPTDRVDPVFFGAVMSRNFTFHPNDDGTVMKQYMDDVPATRGSQRPELLAYTLWSTIKDDNTVAVRFLLEEGADPVTPILQSTTTPLLDSVARYSRPINIEIVKMLLESTSLEGKVNFRKALDEYIQRGLYDDRYVWIARRVLDMVDEQIERAGGVRRRTTNIFTAMSVVSFTGLVGIVVYILLMFLL